MGYLCACERGAKNNTFAKTTLLSGSAVDAIFDGASQETAECCASQNDRGSMGCMHSNTAADTSRPNLFQRNLCLHHKMPASEVYTIQRELGKGAFGIVEEVEHIETKKRFAMKTVTFASGSKRSEFEKEIDILRGLHHPNIVRMVETFEDDHHFYIIMELCEDGTVRF